MSHWPDIADRLDIDPSVYVSPQAYVAGTVTIGPDSSVWPMAVIRGDQGAIRIGARTNIQDGCVLHADSDAYIIIGDDVTLGHGALVHGCTIEDGALIGVGAVVLNHAVIGAGSLVGARALVPEGMVVPPNSLVLGVPGQIKPLRPDQRERMRTSTEHYIALKALYQERETEEHNKRTGF
jgi:carbonic anhydrase/acetyltransferase-like protein (isoleucine patch superfamily)